MKHLAKRYATRLERFALLCQRVKPEDNRNLNRLWNYADHVNHDEEPPENYWLVMRLIHPHLSTDTPIPVDDIRLLNVG